MKHNIVRLSLDMPVEQHIHLKMMAAKKGISMREFILETLAFKETEIEKDQIEVLDNESFRKGLKKVMKDRHQLIKNLSDR